MADSVAQPRFAMLLIGSFAAMALILALIGLYGTLAFLVAQRQGEIGIRLAVGATPRDIRAMVVRQGAGFIAIGIPLGLLLSLFVSRVAARLVIQFRIVDPAVLTAVAGLVAAASFAAILIPARRAARVEPIAALRGN